MTWLAMTERVPPSPPRVAPADQEAFTRLVRRCCEEVGLDPDRDADEVCDAVDEPPDRECCDSGCDPCVLSVVRAAALVRQRRT